VTNVPSTTWRMLSQSTGQEEIPQGLDAAVDRAIGAVERLVRRGSRFLRQADKIISMEKQFIRMSDRRLSDTAAGLRERFRLGRDRVEDRNRAFALVREVAARETGLRPYAVQVAGALAIEAGCIIEMATGEGKTLVATMPAVLAGWRGRGCHVLTANDYLAERDAAVMAPIYKFCGLETAHIEQGMGPDERRQAYNAHITYCTNREVAADFLRDRLAMGRVQGLPSALLAKITGQSEIQTDRLVQRGLECAIVDEADAVMIDEAVTPLIISGEGPNPEQVDAFKQAHRLANELAPLRDYSIDKRYRETDLTETGRQRLADIAASLGGIWAGARRREELVVQALVAREFFIRDEHYVIDNGKVVIVDDFTGRLMPDRTWRDGLHQAVEAKEGLTINLPKVTYARISFQRFFRLYRKLSGMTGTGSESRAEFWQIYHKPVVEIPTHRNCIRKILPDRVFTTIAAKFKAVISEIRAVHKTGRPILVGTRSVQESEHLRDLLATEGLEHTVLNAVRHAEEAWVVAGAGRQGCITVATNMAGRGTDIRLGKNVAGMGGLHVIGTQRHEAGRIDRQLWGRCSRQGNPGIAQAFVSLEDELPQRYARTMTTALLKRYAAVDREISSALPRCLVDRAQHRAERAALRQRKSLLRVDDWLDEYLGFAGQDT
jgi:preprotein translocase subunit SecA